VQKYKELYEVTKNGLQSQTELVAGVCARARVRVPAPSSLRIAGREAELIAREEELVDLRLRVAAADDEIQVGVGAESPLCLVACLSDARQRLREIVDQGPELRTFK
jgi:hypothetical protein